MTVWVQCSRTRTIQPCPAMPLKLLILHDLEQNAYSGWYTSTVTVELDAPPHRANPKDETIRTWLWCSVTKKTPIQRDQEDRTWRQTRAENVCKKRSFPYCDIQGPHSRSEKYAGYSRAKIKKITLCNDVCRRTGRRKTPLMDSSSSSTTHDPDI